MARDPLGIQAFKRYRRIGREAPSDHRLSILSSFITGLFFLTTAFGGGGAWSGWWDWPLAAVGLFVGTEESVRVLRERRAERAGPGS